jgi:uncharacterized protein YndB with AHSA1/START domain
MSTYDWSSFKRSIFIDAPLDKIFDAWIIPEQISTWFLKKADFTQAEGSIRQQSDRIKAGDTYAWQWWNYSETENGRVKLVDRPARRLEFSFAGECTCIVTVMERDGENLLTLEQKDIPLDEESKRGIHVGCGQGWAFWMVNLKAWLEHGILLNDGESKHKSKDYSFCELINR